MFCCFVDKLENTTYIVELEYFEKLSQYDISKADQFKNKGQETYKVGLGIFSKYHLKLFYDIFTNKISLQTLKTEDFEYIFLAAENIRCDKVMLAVVKEMVNRFLAIKDITKMDEF